MTEWWEFAARDFEQTTDTTERRWATPGAMARSIDVATKQTPALDLIDDALVQLADGDVDKQMIFCPPQIGKSERAVRRFVEWLLDHDPTLRIVVASYDKDVAVRWGRRIKQDIEETPELGITLRADSKAAGQWQTAQGGSLYCVGIRGGLSGRPVDILIIDDPVKDRAQAESATQRDAAWDWWENVAKVRAMRTLVIQTRWHTDDLSGRMLTREPGEWSALSIPAIAETDDDPLGREIGEELEPARERPPGYYAHLKTTASPYVWSSLYQQHPTAAEGGIFKRGDWRYWQPIQGGMRVNDLAIMLRDTTRFITMDLATSTKTSADYTVACAWAFTRHGDLVLLDRVRERVPATDHMKLLEPLRQRWLERYDTVYVESRMFGTTLIHSLGRKGLPVRELHADADKLTRALPAADLQAQHRIHLPAGHSGDKGEIVSTPWLDTWLDEHADFPNVAHDDQCDNTAYAARVVLAHLVLPEGERETEQRRVDALATVLDEPDLMTVSW